MIFIIINIILAILLMGATGFYLCKMFVEGMTADQAVIGENKRSPRVPSECELSVIFEEFHKEFQIP